MSKIVLYTHNNELTACAGHAVPKHRDDLKAFSRALTRGKAVLRAYEKPINEKTLDYSGVCGITDGIQGLRELHLQLENGDIQGFPLRLVNLYTIYIQSRWPTAIPLKDLLDYLPDPVKARRPRQTDGASLDLEQMKHQMRESRSRAYVAMAYQEAKFAERNGWFPIMATLTVDDGHLARAGERSVFSTHGWRLYVQRFREMVRKVCGGPNRGYRHEDYARYMCAVEWGSKNGRCHIHVLWFCKDLPASWKRDPNFGLEVPDRREIRPASLGNGLELWIYGIEQHKIVRSHSSDTWGYKCGHCWPVDEAKKPLVTAGALGVAMYIGGYLTKPGGTGSWAARMRMSKGFGVDYVDDALRKLPRSLRRPICALGTNVDWADKARRRLELPISLVSRRMKRIRYEECLKAKPGLVSTMVARDYEPYSFVKEFVSNYRLVEDRRREGASKWTEAMFVGFGLDLGGSPRRRALACDVVLPLFRAAPKTRLAAFTGERF